MAKHPLQEMIEDTGIGSVRSYSGRGMYGKQCLGVEVSRRELGELIGELMKQCLNSDPDDGEAQSKFDEAANAVKDMSTDSMGRDTIVYWEYVPYTPDEDEEGDDEG